MATQHASIGRRVLSAPISLLLVLLVVMTTSNGKLEPENPQGGDNGDRDSSPLQSSSNNTVHQEADDAFLPAPVFQEENGILVLTQVEHIPDALRLDSSPLLVLTLHSPACAHSISFVSNLERVGVRIHQYAESLQTQERNISSTWLPPRLAKLDATRLDTSWLNTLEITSFPRVLWFVPAAGTTNATDNTTDDDTGDDDDVWMMNYEFPKTGVLPPSTTDELYHGVVHAWYHTLFGSVWNVTSMSQLDEVVSTLGPDLFQHVPPALDPAYTSQERQQIEYLMEESDQSEPYVVFIQCQVSADETNTTELFDSYNSVARVLSTRRDVIFFAISESCDADLFAETNTVALLVSPVTRWNRNWRRDVTLQILPVNDESAISVKQFLEIYSTPSVLWFDRVSVAPIAFAGYRRVHAVLFVPIVASIDIVPSMCSVDEAQATIRKFRRACQLQKEVPGRTLVCLVVPHTERRIMTTFGIDIWTPLDVQAMSEDYTDEGLSSLSVVPALLVTDQRFSGTLKYYMNSTSIAREVSSIDSFLNFFWEGRLSPFLPSSKKPLRRNKSHVQVITGDTFRQAILDTTEKHTLLLLFTPTCGHCKRFSVLWNTLSRLIHHIQWDSFLDVAKIDVSQNQIITEDLHIDVHDVPDVYYFPSGDEKHKPLRYDVLDKFGDGAGRLRDPLEIINWLLDVADDPSLREERLLELLEKGRGEHQETEESL